MLGRVYRIFLRYAARHTHLETRAVDPVAGTTIERVSLIDNRLVVEGWTDAERVGFKLSKGLVRGVPSILQMGSDSRGFVLKLPYQAGAGALLLERGATETEHPLPGFDLWRIRLAYGAQAFRFVWTLICATPLIWRWKVGGDLGARELVKQALGLVVTSDATEIDARVFDPYEALVISGTISIVLPVYNAMDLLPETLRRVVEHTSVPWRLVLIEDCSTDPEVRPFLRSWVAENDGQSIQLLENDANLGFIGSVNRALAEAMQYGDPVVLLNSDAMVPQGWAQRLLAPFETERDIATVTPMSNDAEIFTVPSICRRNDPPSGDIDALDRLAQVLNPVPFYADAPTGVGFCMALSPRFLALEPTLDPVFGKGYGEETDWCQRARVQGGRHVCATNLVVEHRGAASFGTAEKQALLEKNGKIITQRYPDYPAEVQNFIRCDPLATPRLVLGLAQAGLRAEVSIFVAHAMGGGAETYLQSCILDLLAKGRSAVVLRVGQGHRWLIELRTPDGTCEGFTNDTAMLERLLAPISKRRIVYSCAVGDIDPVEIPQVLLDLAKGHEARIEILFHDFFPLSPSYTLLDDDGVYRGVPRTDTTDPAHSVTRPGGAEVNLRAWRDAWSRVILAAQDLIVFCDDSREIVAEAYPEAADRLKVVPHQMKALPPPAKAKHGNTPVIGVLGNIGAHKGAGVVSDMSRSLSRSRAAHIVVLGNVDPKFRVYKPSQVHGDYMLEELPQLIEQYGIDRWLIPSIWPETFSFTTREALATGLPVWVFDLGAQAEAVRAVHGETTLLRLRASGGVDIEASLGRLLNLPE